jgi:putative nucleotidyltransferase with HDIG domain
MSKFALGKKIIKLLRLNKLTGRKANGKSQSYVAHWLIGIVSVITVVALFPRGKSYQFVDLKEGEIYVGEQIVAPFDFSINKTNEQYEKDKQSARRSVAPVFVRIDSISYTHTHELRMLLDSTEVVLRSELNDSTKASRLKKLFGNYKILVPDEDLIFFLKKLQGTPKKSARTKSKKRAAAQEETNDIVEFKRFRDTLISIAQDIYTVGVLNVSVKDLPNNPDKIAIDDGKNELVGQISAYNDVESLNTTIREKLRNNFEFDNAVKAAYFLLNTFIRPNIYFKEEETSSRIKAAEALVPKARGIVLKDENIIDSHEKINKEHIQKLNSLAEALELREDDSNIAGILVPLFGKTIFVLLSFSLLAVFLFLDERKVFQDTRKILMIAITILLVLFLGRFVSELSSSEYLIPVAIASMLLTIFYNAKIGFMGTITLALLLGGMRGNDFGIVIITLVVGSASTLSVRKVRSRSWVFQSILWITAGYIVSIISLELSRYSAIDNLLNSLLFGVINGFLCPVLTYGLMVIFEYLFDMTTDATLLELSDLNKPLLRKLAMRAPGTYHHSFVVGSLAEAAAEAIGANSLLTRVGSYYHDIGKMDKPEYFVENQKGGKNPHDKLSPNMSYLIIVNHVKRGLEMAEENKLPKEIQAFIAEHHGTNLISYFYSKALDKKDDTEISETDFRYPGPKPQSKETGIVMLADTVEATSRTLKDPSVSRLRGMVNSIIDDRFKNCELDESPLTLRELTLIQEAFVQILTGIFHGRIEYPEQEKRVSPEKPEAAPQKESEHDEDEEYELEAAIGNG